MSHRWKGRELPPPPSDDALGSLEQLSFVHVGTLEWSTLSGEAFGPVFEAAKAVFEQTPGAVSRLDVDVKYGRDDLITQFPDGSRGFGERTVVELNLVQPRLHVYRVQRGTQVLGLVYLNRGVGLLGGIGE